MSGRFTPDAVLKRLARRAKRGEPRHVGIDEDGVEFLDPSRYTPARDED